MLLPYYAYVFLRATTQLPRGAQLATGRALDDARYPISIAYTQTHIHTQINDYSHFPAEFKRRWFAS